jgi:8-oxo-dGTP diphosphatase
MIGTPHPARTVDAIHWPSWEPGDRATLLFVIRDGQALLIRKKRGLGAGKINAPGGRLEAGETPLECAIREVQEEVGVTARRIRHCGRHRFQFTDGYKLFVDVFAAEDCDGEAIETDEALPMWVPTDKIPYEEMWADDRHWIPLMLEGTPFDGRYVFDGDTMLDMVLETTAT